MCCEQSNDIITLFGSIGRAAASQCEHLMSLHSLMLTINPCLTTTPALAGRVIMCFKASVGPGLRTFRLDVRSLAFIEEYWRPPQQSDPLCSDLGFVRLYSTNPKVYYIINTWRILGPAPIIRNAVHQTIPHGKLPRTQAQRQRDYRKPKRTWGPVRMTAAHNGLWIYGPSKQQTPGEFNHAHLKEQPKNIWLLSLMWWSWIMQVVSTWLVGPNGITRACGLVNCLLAVFLYIYSPSRLNSCWT